MAVPHNKSFTARFSAKHGVEIRNLPPAERSHIDALLRCEEALDADYAALSQETLASDPSVGVLWHLLGRSAEMAEACVVAWAAASPAGAEVLARATIERAISILYVIRDPRPRLAAYFVRHVEDVDRQIRQWRKLSESRPDVERKLHLTACDRRATANEDMRRFVSRVESELLESGIRHRWPTQIASMFAEVGLGVTYRTVYARLSSETHFDAEETLRYILARVGGADLMQRMGLETVGFTRLSIAIAVAYHLRAILAYADKWGLANTIAECKVAVAEAEDWAESLSEDAGSIQDTRS